MNDKDIEANILLLQNTQVIFFSHSGSRDEKVYKNASIFDPTRHLNESGQYMKDKKNLLFGSGKRKCVAEGLARVEMFLFFTAVVQQFKVTVEGPVDNLRPGLMFYPGGPSTIAFECRK